MHYIIYIIIKVPYMILIIIKKFGWLVQSIVVSFFMYISWNCNQSEIDWVIIFKSSLTSSYNWSIEENSENKNKKGWCVKTPLEKKEKEVVIIKFSFHFFSLYGVSHSLHFFEFESVA